MPRFNPRLTSAARRTSRRGADVWPDGVSIHASLQQRGEHDSAGRSIRTTHCFNPRLTSAARRTLLIAGLRIKQNVSIHASLQQRGERQFSGAAELLFEFQSTPHFSSEANGGIVF